jgi:hypothetical protein
MQSAGWLARLRLILIVPMAASSPHLEIVPACYSRSTMLRYELLRDKLFGGLGTGIAPLAFMLISLYSVRRKTLETYGKG